MTELLQKYMELHNQLEDVYLVISELENKIDSINDEMDTYYDQLSPEELTELKAIFSKNRI